MLVLLHTKPFAHRYVGNLWSVADPSRHFGYKFAPVRFDPFQMCVTQLDSIFLNNFGLSDTTNNIYRWAATVEYGPAMKVTSWKQNTTQVIQVF